MKQADFASKDNYMIPYFIKNIGLISGYKWLVNDDVKVSTKMWIVEQQSNKLKIWYALILKWLRMKMLKNNF